VCVVVASNLVAILLQTLSARLGICTGKHLAQVKQLCLHVWKQLHEERTKKQKSSAQSNTQVP
jgi:hypothetical protein